MPLGVETATLVFVLAVVFLGGLVKGVAGFGYAVASTALLATFLAPSRAAVIMILVGISTVRVGAAWALGLYATGSVLALSVLAAVPGIAGVVAGSRLRSHVPPTYQTAGTLLLLTVIAARLATAGLSGL